MLKERITILADKLFENLAELTHTWEWKWQWKWEFWNRRSFLTLQL